MSKTQKMYYENQYMYEFTASIDHVKEKNGQAHIALDRTCFYPGGGGQPCDIGFLNDREVIECYEESGYIYHVLKAGSLPTEIHGYVDAVRRMGFMENHTGEHILSGIAKDEFAANNVGFHMSEQGFTMDLDRPLSPEEIGELEILANIVVSIGRAVETKFVTGKVAENTQFRSKKSFAPDEMVRIVTIEDYDYCACAALHVHNSGAVRIIKIVSHQKYKGGVRLNVLCGTDAWYDYSQKNDICHEAGARLSADMANIIPALDKLIQRKADLQKHADKLQNTIFELKAEKIEEGANLAYFFEDGLEMTDLRRFATLATQRAKIAAVLTGQDGAYKYAICGQDAEELNIFAKSFTANLDGSGGLSPNMATGFVKATSEDIRNFLRASNG